MSCLDWLLYVTKPRSNQRELPDAAVQDCASQPPVQDSATTSMLFRASSLKARRFTAPIIGSSTPLPLPACLRNAPLRDALDSHRPFAVRTKPLADTQFSSQTTV